MKNHSSVLKRPVGRQRFPDVKFEKTEDFFFCAFYPTSGFSDIGSKRLISRTIHNSIITGNKSIILRWLNAEDNLEFAVPEGQEERSIKSLLRRKFRIGDHFRGQRIDESYNVSFNSKSSGFTTTEGDSIAFTEQTAVATYSIITNSKYFLKKGSENQIDIDKIKLFWIAPELAENDVLYIENFNFIPNNHGKAHHIELNFVSLGDQLRAVGRTLESRINFAEPGATFFPFPHSYYDYTRTEEEPTEGDEEESVVDNPYDVESLFAPIDDETVTFNKEKRLYLAKNPSLIDQRLTDSAFSYKIEFDGATMLNSICFLGRPAPSDLVINSGEENEETIPSWQLISRTRKILTWKTSWAPQTIASSQGEDEGLPYPTKYRTISGEVKIRNWFTNFLEEYGYYFDPNKQRNSEPVFMAEVTNNILRGTTFDIRDQELKSTEINGIFKLATNIWSNYNINAEIPLQGDSVQPGSNKSDRTTQQHNVASFLNTQAIINNGLSYLEAGGVITINSKGLWSQGVDSILLTGGTISAVAVGATTGGIGAIAVGAITSLAKIAKDTLFRWLPDRWFTRSDVYRPPSKIDFLLPENLADDIFNKRQEPDNRIFPLEIFANPEQNYLSGFINGKNYRMGFVGGLTHIVKIGGEEERIDSIRFDDSRNPINVKASAIYGQIPNPEEGDYGYAIDGMMLITKTKVPYRITFYNNAGVRLWSQTRMTQAGYTGRIQEVGTWDFFSDYNWSEAVDDDPGFAFQRYEDRSIQAIADRNKEVLDAARERLNNLREVPMAGADNQNIFVRTRANRDTVSRGSYPSFIRMLYYLTSPNIDSENQRTINIPTEVENDLKIVHSLPDTTSQKTLIKKLQDEYGFKFLEIGITPRLSFNANIWHEFEGRKGNRRATETARQEASGWVDDFPFVNKITLPEDDWDETTDGSADLRSFYGTTANESRKIQLHFPAHSHKWISRRGGISISYTVNHEELFLDVYWGYWQPDYRSLLAIYGVAGNLNIGVRFNSTTSTMIQARITTSNNDWKWFDETSANSSNNNATNLLTVDYAERVNYCKLTKE